MSAVSASLAIVAYLALFVAVGGLFLFANLLVGWFVRPSDPHEEKQEIYECGEPTIGSSFVQFDLRFYVVALVFLIFDVEVAFLFPWATLFGKSVNLASPRTEVVEVTEAGAIELTRNGRHLIQELGIREPTAPLADPAQPLAANLADATLQLQHTAQSLVWFSAAAVGLFFVVLLIGFAYEWKTGAFDWVRALTRERAAGRSQRRPPEPRGQQQEALPA